MKRITIVLLVLLYACSQQPEKKDISEQAKKEIIDADKAANEMAAKEGFLKTILYYSDDSIIKPKEGALPIIGKKELASAYAGQEDTKDISWEPFRAEASSSGDFGYSFGNWKYKIGDSTIYGNYYTIWKKQKDGSWKFVVDGGHRTPPPNSK